MLSYGELVFWLFVPVMFGGMVLFAVSFLSWLIVKIRDSFTFADNEGIF